MASIGTKSKYTVSHEVITQLEKSGKSGKCVSVTENHYDQCIIEKMQELMINETGCTVPWVPDKNKTCSEPNLSKSFPNLSRKQKRSERHLSKQLQFY